jgi:glucose-6-phosphate 1-epimerase
MSAEELRAKFGIAGVLDFADEGELVKAVITRDGMQGELFLQGATVTRWAPSGQRPVIFTSPKAIYAPGTAIRGGMPIIFPWFGPHRTNPKAPQHGFVRAAPWQLDSVSADKRGEVAMVLSRGQSETPSEVWPEPFRATFAVTFGSTLSVSLSVRNLAAHPVTFEEALHTYFEVSDVTGVAVSGLAGGTYIDKVDGAKRKTEASNALKLTGETDRVYLSTGPHIAIEDPEWKRRIRIEKEGAASIIVWNLWEEKARAMRDMGDPAWRSFICVETGNAADNEVHLAANSEHVLSTLIAVDAIA